MFSFLLRIPLGMDLLGHMVTLSLPFWETDFSRAAITFKFSPRVYESESRSVVSNPMDYTVYGTLQARMLEWVAFPFSRGSSQPRDWTQVSLIADRFFTSWTTRETLENWSGLAILSPVIFPTQELNQGFLHCRRTLKQLSYEGSPRFAAKERVIGQDEM